MQTLKTGEAWELVGIDLTGPHPKSSRGHIYILTIVDHFTKFVITSPIRDQEAKTVADAVVKSLVNTFGCPKAILTDRGANFESQLFREMCKILEINKLRTSPYWPRGNGCTERWHSCMNAMIAKTVKANHRNWNEVLPFVTAAYNASVSEATGYSPNYLIFGHENAMAVDLIFGVPPRDHGVNHSDYVCELKERLDQAYELVRNELKTAAQRRADRYQYGVKPREFDIGEKVWYYSPRRRQGKYAKWCLLYQGPFVIVDKVGPVNYRLKLEKGGNSFVTHVDKLKRCLGLEGPESPVEEEDETRPEMMSGRGNRPVRERRLPTRFL